MAAIEISKCTIAAAGNPVPGSGVAFEITQSCVSGDTYGLAWNTSPACSANVGPKNGLLASFVDRSANSARTP